jgi:hypothetical protein
MTISPQALATRALERFRPAPRRGLRFGIAELDVLLPFGVPRGQLTALEAPLGSGGTALLLALAETTLRADEGVALVDAARTLAPHAAAHLAERGQFWVIRPRGTASAWWCADVLLRTGAFGLVIVDQAPRPPRRVAIRLQRLARDKDAALVMRETGGAGERGSGEVGGASRGHPVSPSPGIALVLHVEPAADGFVPALPGSGAAWPGPRTVRVLIEKGGAPRAAEVPVGFALPHRLRPHWAVRDRRPGARAGAGRSRRRRAAEPDRPG